MPALRWAMVGDPLVPVLPFLVLSAQWHGAAGGSLRISGCKQGLTDCDYMLNQMGHDGHDALDDETVWEHKQGKICNCNDRDTCKFLPSAADIGHCPDHGCQCNPGCSKHKDCCDDYEESRCPSALWDSDPQYDGDMSSKKVWGFWIAACGLYLMTCAAAKAFYELQITPADVSLIAEAASVSQAKRKRYAVDTSEAALHGNYFRIRCRDPVMEAKFRAKSTATQFQTGVVTLIASAACLSLYEIYSILEAYEVECLQPTPWLVHVLSLSTLVGSLAGSIACYQDSKYIDIFYWPLIGVHFFYFTAIQIYPLTWSCEQLASEDCRDTASNLKGEAQFSTALVQAVHHVDCSLQGHTAVQMLMTWMLLQPWLLPRLEMLHLVWFWIIGVYCGWTMIFRWFTGETTFEAIDVATRLLLLSLSLSIAIVRKFTMEKGDRARFLQDEEQRETSKKIFNILEYMMPKDVIRRLLKYPDKQIADQIERVSILFILIADFDQKTKSMYPTELLAFLNDIFTQFDKICATHRVTKIETVGEEYVACVGVGEDQEENVPHSLQLERLFEAAADILETQTPDVKFKMGVHTGPIVAGVIGTKLPRFRLFGDTINSAARMMQKGVEGQAQFGIETFDTLPPEVQAKVEKYGDVELKGKGKILAYRFPSLTNVQAKRPSQKVAKSDADALQRQTKRASISDLALERECIDPALERTQSTRSGLEEESMVMCKSITMAEEEAFQQTLQDVKENEITSGGSKTWLLSEKDAFTHEMDERWREIHHENSVSKKISKRFGRTVLVLLFLTYLEMWYMFEKSVYRYKHALYPGVYRLPVFIYTRGFVIFVTCLCWYAAESTEWFTSQKLRSRSQALILAFQLIAIFMIYLSYDAFIWSDITANRHKAAIFEKKFTAPVDRTFTLNFVLFFFLYSRDFGHRFFPSCSFLALAIIIAVFQPLYHLCDPDSKWESMFTTPGKCLLLVQQTVNIFVAHEDEQTSRARFKAQESVHKVKDRTDNILNRLMPPLVLQRLEVNRDHKADPYRHACIAQSDLCGFTKLASTRTPKEVVRFMGELFGAFDVLTDKHGVYKVETVGDAYIAGMAEEPLTQKYSPVNVLLFGFDMTRAVHDWARGMQVAVKCRVGIHYGECIGGIVGTEMQRYHLFGDLMTTIEIMESTAPEGGVQVSRACKEEVERQLRDLPGARGDNAGRWELKECIEIWDDESKTQQIDKEGLKLSFKERTEASLKTSKGEAHDFDEVGGRTFVVQQDIFLD